MRHALENIFWLTTKEVRSMLHDFALLGLVIYSFSLAIYAQSQGTTGELHSAAIAIVDQDHSQLSRDIAKAFLPPYFQSSMSVSPQQVEQLLDTSAYTFILDIPPHFMRDVVAGRTPAVQVNVDATAAMQAGIGVSYIQQILASQIARYAARSDEVPAEPVKLVTHMAYNPNLTTSWFNGIMGIVNNVTMLAIILCGAAVVREREHGTMDHLLFMPLTPFQIAMAKIVGNGAVIAVAAWLSLTLLRTPASAHSGARVGAVVYERGNDISVLLHLDRHFPWHGRPFYAAAWPAFHPRRSAYDAALGRQYPRREHASPVAGHYAGLAGDAFRCICQVDPAAWRRRRRGLVTVPCRIRYGAAVSCAFAAPFPAYYSRKHYLMCPSVLPAADGRFIGQVTSLRLGSFCYHRCPAETRANLVGWWILRYRIR